MSLLSPSHEAAARAKQKKQLVKPLLSANEDWGLESSKPVGEPVFKPFSL